MHTSLGILRLKPWRAALTAATIVFVSGCTRDDQSTRPNGNPVQNAKLMSDAAAPHEIWFQDRSSGSGLDFIHDSGHRTRFLLPETICGGVALFDMDNDGLLDVYLVQTGHIADAPPNRKPNRLFRNLGDFQFEDITEGSGADHRGLGMGVAVGDYNNDGWPDLYITNLGPNVLLRNDGATHSPPLGAGGHFTDVSRTAGVDHAGFGAGAAFLDYDHDGWLDLIVVNYIHWSIDIEGSCAAADGQPDYCSPRSYRAPTVDVLYRNNGPPDFTFTEVTAAAGLGDSTGNGLGVVCGDFNGDGLIDIYIANDLTRNRLWINQGNGTLIDRALELGCAIDETGIEKAGMGVMAVDHDDDGDLDLLVVNLGLETDSYYRHEGAYFIDATSKVGLSAPSRRATRFGVGMIDFDNDGWLDVYEANGRVGRSAPQWNDDPYAEPNLLMRGTPGRRGAAGRFIEIKPAGGTASPLIATSRAAAFGDLDNDGSIDILIVNRDGPVHLLRNVIGQQNNHLICRVLNEHESDALGATVIAHSGDRIIRRDVRSAYSYFAANDPRVHFGLGESKVIDELIVIWPNGVRESFGELAANQLATLRRGTGTALPDN